MIVEIKLLAKWCATRKYSASGKKKDAVWMKPNIGDPLPMTHPDVHNWIRLNIGRFQKLVTKTREELQSELHPGGTGGGTAGVQDRAVG